ncbi:MAG TPA: hypothetical protein VFR37_04005, partial [Longimicrobium sp.]|nr:hypothetical protein [Longimicrobium sp.]
MPLRSDIGREVVRGTICKDKWRARVSVLCADVLPAGQPSPLLVSVAWRDASTGAPVAADDDEVVELSLRQATPSALGNAAFAGDAGPRRLTGNVAEQLLTIVGTTTATAGTSRPAAPEVELVVKVEGEERAVLPLRVDAGPAALRMEEEDGDPPPTVLGPGARFRLRTAAAEPPPAGGRMRWVSGAPPVALEGSATAPVAEVAGRFPPSGGPPPPLWLWALYAPPGGTEVLQASHQFAPGAVRLRLSGRVVDAHPFAPGVPETVPGAEVRGGDGTTSSAADGTFTLEAGFAYGELLVDVERAGITTRRLRVSVTGQPGAPVDVAVADAASGTQLGTVQLPGAGATGDLALGDLAVVVHKVRGTVLWPDSRTVDDAAYAGTPLMNRRVYAVPLAPGDPVPQRPADTLAWAALKARPDCVFSARPGRAAQGERTAADGAWELRFVDLVPGRRWLLWVESPDAAQAADPGRAVETPEYTVRTVYRELRRLTAPRASQVDDTG